MMMIEPAAGAAHCRHGVFDRQKHPSRFTAVCRRQSANDISTAMHKMPIPALATITSRPPKRSWAVSIIAGPPSSTLYVLAKKDRFAPAPPIFSATARPAVSFKSVTTTLAPPRTSVAAHAAPIPDAPPATIATLASNLALGVLQSAERRKSIADG
jgi:hypothetical protein